jgi:hypothetical protein
MSVRFPRFRHCSVTKAQSPAKCADGGDVTPFPALHTTANTDAEEHRAAARKLAEDAESWLADLDAVLGESPSRFDLAR